jgi:hypothetical protein
MATTITRTNPTRRQQFNSSNSKTAITSNTGRATITICRHPPNRRTQKPNNRPEVCTNSRQVGSGNRDSGYYNSNYDMPTRNYLQPSAATTPAPNVYNTQQQPQQNTADGGYPPSRLPPTYTKVQSGVGSHTQVHAILDYDPGPDDEQEDEYYDDDEHGNGECGSFQIFI